MERSFHVKNGENAGSTMTQQQSKTDFPASSLSSGRERPSRTPGCLGPGGEDEVPSSSGNVSPFMVLINLTQHTHVLVQDSYSMCYTCLTGC